MPTPTRCSRRKRFPTSSASSPQRTLSTSPGSDSCSISTGPGLELSTRTSLDMRWWGSFSYSYIVICVPRKIDVTRPVAVRIKNDRQVVPTRCGINLTVIYASFIPGQLLGEDIMQCYSHVGGLSCGVGLRYRLALRRYIRVPKIAPFYRMGKQKLHSLTQLLWFIQFYTCWL